MRCIHLLFLFAFAEGFPFSSRGRRQAPINETLELLQVVVLSRHGARAPYPPDKHNLTAYTRDREGPVFASLSKPIDEQFGVPPAWLTKAGGVNVRLMGGFFREHYIEGKGFPFGPKAGCEWVREVGLVFFYADDSERDVETAGNFSLGFIPECDPQPYVEKDYVLTLFNQGANTSLCPLATRAEIQGLIGAEDTKELNENVIAANRILIHEINNVLDCCQPEVCANSINGECTLLSQPVGWSSHFWDLFTGPINTAAYWAEYFELQYVNNSSDVMFSHPTPRVTLPPPLNLTDKLAQYGALHLTVFDTSVSYWAAQNFGSEMMSHILATMESVITGKYIPGLQTGPNARFVYYAGHDINILFLRHFLNIDWFSRGWARSQPVLGGMLVFELHRGTISGQHYVKTFYVSQSMDQLRYQTPLSDKPGGSAPWRAAIAVPGCEYGPGLACPWEQFRTLALLSVRPQCIHNEFVREYANAAKAKTMDASMICEHDRNIRDILTIAICILLVLLASLIFAIATMRFVPMIRLRVHSGTAAHSRRRSVKDLDDEEGRELMENGEAGGNMDGSVEARGEEGLDGLASAVNGMVDEGRL